MRTLMFLLFAVGMVTLSQGFLFDLLLNRRGGGGGGAAPPKAPSKKITPQDKLKADIDFAVGNFSDLAVDFQKFKTEEIEPLKKDIAELKKVISSMDSEYPAFYAYRIANYKLIGIPISYDGVLLNVKSALDVNSGVFTAPAKGVYYFAFQALKEPGSPHVTVVLKHNQKEITTKRVEPNTDSSYNKDEGDNSMPISLQATLLLDKGDSVAVYLDSGSLSDANHDDLRTKTATFTGFLVQN